MNLNLSLGEIADTTKQVSAPPAGITGAAFEAGGEGAATAGEGFAMGVGFLKIGFDGATFLYGLYQGCTQ